MKKIVLFNYHQSVENTPACETAERSAKVTGISGCCLDIKRGDDSAITTDQVTFYWSSCHLVEWRQT